MSFLVNFNVVIALLVEFQRSNKLNISNMKNPIVQRTFWLCMAVIFCSLKISAQLSVIQTENGIVSGYKSGDISIFKGIPFAAPPVGDLRWKAPQPVKNWTGILKCEKFSASPMQRTPVPFMMWTEEFITPPGNLSEDCLYLNIWTPARSAKEKLPVFVWIYGGGFSSGSAACAVYDGEEMAKKGVIFVSLNYRVGVLGFLALPELSHESENKVSGNYGLLDQVAALKWVKQNIEAFGGDPQKVTIAGQSAGSMSVCDLVASPLAKGLFRGAIAQSGGILNSRMNTNLSEAEKSGQAFMEKMKVANIAELRNKSAEELIAAGGNFGPVSDGTVIPMDVFAAFRTGQFNDVPMMAGWVTGDGSIMGNEAITTEKYKEQASQNYGDKANEFLKLFPGNTSEQITSSLKEIGLFQFAGLPAHLWAEFSKKRAYLYQFSHIPVDKPGFPEYGAFHTSEVPFALHTLHLWKRPWREVDYEVEKTTNAYWVNFVRTGDPNGEGLPEWKSYNKNSGDIMELGDQPRLSPGLYKTKFDFLEKIEMNKK
jgi:para-nitrobenzyl esterase